MSKGKESKPHIGIYGRRNNGKSSLINMLTGQSVAIVSDFAGTTTDPVKKSLEITGFGPVILIDTAGIDDIGELGQKRIAKTLETINHIDLAILVIANNIWGEFEDNLIAEFKKTDTPFIVAHATPSIPQLKRRTKIRSSIKLSIIEPIVKYIGVREFPTPLSIAEIPNSIKEGRVVVIITMSKYLTASGNTSSGIDKNWKIGLLKMKNITVRNRELIRRNIWSVSEVIFTFFKFFAPKYCDTRTDPPIVIPATRAERVKRIGKLAPTAARATEPINLPTTILSTILYN